MSFAVMPCPGCGRLKIAQIPVKTTGCPWCGKRFPVGQTPQREFETLHQARLALSALSSDGKMEAIETSAAKKAGLTQFERLESAAEALTKERGEFSEEEFAARARADGISNWEMGLKRLVDNGSVYEARAGLFKSL
ncbi:MAG: hypothetical protein V1934_05410 [Methanobacteriota archaeon]